MIGICSLHARKGVWNRSLSSESGVKEKEVKKPEHRNNGEMAEIAAVLEHRKHKTS